jgi:uncharacterized protein YdbL (DUF1318 family)
MKKITKYLAMTFCLLASLSAFAIDLGAAKSQGLVGERADGYLGAVRGSASADVRTLINDVNSKRKDQYQRIAVKNSIPLAEVEALAGKKTIAKTPSGGWVFVETWRQK